MQPPSRHPWQIRAPLAPSRALLHPVFLGSLALLLANDHLWKQNLAWPRWLTGRLSDVVGPIVAGTVIAVVLGARRPAAVAAAYVGAMGFVAAINLSAPLAAAVEAATAWLATWTPLPAWSITVDPGDCLALLLAPLGIVPLWRAMASPAALPSRRRRLAQGLALAAAATASAATSSQPPEPWPIDEFTFAWDARLVLGNATTEPVRVRVRRLSAKVALDCHAVLAAPSERLARAAFGPGQTFELLAGRTMPLGPTKQPESVGLDAAFFADREPCDAALVEANGLTPRLVAWSTATYPWTGVDQRTAIARPERLVSFDADKDGGLRWRSHPTVHSPPPEQPGNAPAGCGLEDDARTLADNFATYFDKQVSVGSGAPFLTTLESISQDPAGCYRLQTAHGQLWLCLAPGALDGFAPGKLDIRLRPLGQDGGTLDGYTLANGNLLVRVGRGAQPVLFGQGNWATTTAAGCPLVTTPCGSVGQRLTVILKAAATGTVSIVEAGATWTPSPGSKLWIQRAVRLDSGLPGCPDGVSTQQGAAGVWMETVYREEVKP